MTKKVACTFGTATAKAGANAHHVIPMFMGGKAKQASMIDMSKGLHRVLHRLIDALVKDNKVLSELGLTALGGASGSAAAWEQALTDNPAAQEAMEAVLKRAADVIDKECGNVKPTTLRSAVDDAFDDKNNLEGWAK